MEFGSGGSGDLVSEPRFGFAISDLSFDIKDSQIELGSATEVWISS